MSDVLFQPGDVVQLKSGGPAMVVERVGEDGQVACAWQDRKGQVCIWTWQPWVLEAVPVSQLTQAEQYLRETGQYIKRTMDGFRVRTGDAKD